MSLVVVSEGLAAARIDVAARTDAAARIDVAAITDAVARTDAAVEGRTRVVVKCVYT